MKKPPATQGFTLIELMIVVAIIAVLATIAIPKYTSLVAKSRESTVKGHLGALRSALSIYYSDTEGFFPASGLTPLLAKFIPEIPDVQLPRTDFSTGHPGSNPGVLIGDVPSALDDMAGAQGWLYNDSPTTTTWGRVIVNCTHSDFRGNSWSSF